MDQIFMLEIIKIRPTKDIEMPAAFLVARQLRDHLDLNEFTQRVNEQRGIGYELYGAFEHGHIRGLIGFRFVTTLARGRHIHVDDLVVDQQFRRRGIGSALLSFVEHLASESDRVAIFLDSRQEVIDFYAKHDFSPHTATLMRKRVFLIKEKTND